MLRAPFYLAATLVILFEDFLWEPLQRLGAWFGHLPGLRRLEARIAALPPKAALAMFLTPTVVLLPFKFLALAAFTRGHFIVGLGVAVGAKVVGTALVARIFALCKPTLLTVPWFARAYAWVTMVRELTLGALRRTPLYRGVKNLAISVRQGLARLTRR